MRFRNLVLADPSSLINTAYVALTYKKLDKKTEAKEYAEKALKLKCRDAEMEEVCLNLQFLIYLLYRPRRSAKNSLSNWGGK